MQLLFRLFRLQNPACSSSPDFQTGSECGRFHYVGPDALIFSMHLRIVGALIVCLAARLVAQTPEWIWGEPGGDTETRYFRHRIVAPAGSAKAEVIVAADNSAEVFFNGTRIGANTEWSKPSRLKVPAVKAGENLVEVTAKNGGGVAALLVRVEIFRADGTRQIISSDSSWETSPDGKSGWIAAKSLGRLGVEPWGDVALNAAATPAESLIVPPGFKVELLRSSESGEGSWVAMTVDDKGRLIVSPQGGEPMLRITVGATGITKMETIDLPVRGAMGLLHAYGALYANARGAEGYHLYRLRDNDGDDRFDSVELLRRWNGDAGEHGPHGIVKGPDGRLYSVNGNFVDLPGDLSRKSPVRNYADDLVLPRMEDGNGFGAGRKPPGGYVVSVDPDGGDARLFAAGERNTYDIAFNAEGELFGFDSDMEWDWGMPWYRPTRVHHVVSGADHGFREGSGKWPSYYADSLPPVVDIGIGSPTGVRFGIGAKFPAKYRDALYVMDWSYGRIMAVHLEEKGASYTGVFENFVKGRPLNVTDLEVGADGAMYFTTGGRGVQSGLYRVTYSGADPGPASVATAAARDARALRRELERSHGVVTPGFVDSKWAALGSPDRSIRYAARIALESQPVDEWRSKTLAEMDPAIGLTASLALARVGNADDQLALLKALARWPLDGLNDELFLTKLRVIEVALARHGVPEGLRPMAIDKLARQFPAPTWPKNRELSQILVALGDPSAVGKILDLRDSAGTQEEQLHYMAALRGMRAGWTMDLRQRYFSWFIRTGVPEVHQADFNKWFADLGFKPRNGASFDGFVKNLRKEAFAKLSDDEKGPIGALLGASAPARKPVAPAATRKFVKDWKLDDIALGDVAAGRNYTKGKAAFTAAQCAACHRFNGEGGAVGPDLTGVGSRYARADIWKSIVDPSAVISEQYQAKTFTLKDGEEVTGRLVEETPAKLVVVTDPLADRRTELKPSDVKGSAASAISPMPEGLLSNFTRDEILDLLAYLESNGREDAPVFKAR